MMNQQKALKQFTHLIDSTPSIEFVEFVKRDDILDRLIMNAGLAEQEVSQCGVGCEEIEWVTKQLKQLAIHGNMIFYFHHPEHLFRYLTSAHIHFVIGNDYRWVEPLWNLSYDFTFIPLDKSFYCQVMWDESAYKIFITYLKDLPEDDDE
jgi:hypothetical protein